MSDDDVTRPGTFVPFLPYIVIGAAHVGAQAAGWHQVATISKIALMPALAVALVWAMRRRDARLIAFTLLPIGLSWFGDVALELPGDTWFVVGLLGFLFSHVAYLVLFLAVMRVGRPPVAALVYVAWYAAFLLLLAPHLGGLLVPVALYGAVLATMAAVASAGGRLMAWGGVCFVVSDSLLALGKFLPGFGIPLQGALIMATYIAAQGLIIGGVVRWATRRRSVAPPFAELVEADGSA